jgi:hypothetical protein
MILTFHLGASVVIRRSVCVGVKNLQIWKQDMLAVLRVVRIFVLDLTYMKHSFTMIALRPC